MNDEPVDFALIGHQESWRSTADVFALLRGPGYPPVPDEEIMSIVPWIPPRAVCRVQTHSLLGCECAWTIHRLVYSSRPPRRCFPAGKPQARSRCSGLRG